MLIRIRGRLQLLISTLSIVIYSATLGIACQTVGVQGAATAYEGTELIDKPAAPDFRLVDHRGLPASLSEFRGQLVVLSFLDSRCVDVCPFTAVILRNIATNLGPSAGRVAYLGVNVNPLAHEVEDVRLWTEQNRLQEIPGWRFFTGTPSELETVWQTYFISVEITNDGHDNHTHIAHTAGIYLIDGQGRERWYVGVEPDASAVATMSRTLTERIQALLKEG